jgi:hypothetical protein
MPHQKSATDGRSVNQRALPIDNNDGVGLRTGISGQRARSVLLDPQKFHDDERCCLGQARYRRR